MHEVYNMQFYTVTWQNHFVCHIGYAISSRSTSDMQLIRATVLALFGATKCTCNLHTPLSNCTVQLLHGARHPDGKVLV